MEKFADRGHRDGAGFQQKRSLSDSLPLQAFSYMHTAFLMELPRQIIGRIMKDCRQFLQ